MYSLWSRTNAIFFYGVTVLLIAAFASSFTTLWFVPVYNVRELRLHELKNIRSMFEHGSRGTATDRALFSFNLDADLTGVWNWNVKQLFCYVTAEFVTPSNIRNELVIWDKIVTKPADAALLLKEQPVKYPLIDQHRELRGTVLSLTLHWDVMPITGVLYSGGGGKHSVVLPDRYCSGAECHVQPA